MYINIVGKYNAIEKEMIARAKIQNKVFSYEAAFARKLILKFRKLTTRFKLE